MTSISDVLPVVRGMLDEAERDCALAMEQAAERAAAKLDADRLALIAQGRQIERERTLLLIALQLEQLRENGTNALALHALRRAIHGEEVR